MSDFQDIDLLFGSDCPLCAVNMKKLWCEFTCSPNQSEFLKAGEQIKVKVGQKYLDVLEVDFHVSLNATCNIYSSCSKIPEVAMMSSSAMGFVTFQCDHAVDRGNVQIKTMYHDDIQGGFKPVSFEVHKCNKDINGTLDGYKNVTTCPCKLYPRYELRAYVAAISLATAHYGIHSRHQDSSRGSI